MQSVHHVSTLVTSTSFHDYHYHGSFSIKRSKEKLKYNYQIQHGSKRLTLQIKAMRAVVQRVTSASVEVEGKIVSEIGPGLLVLVGVHESDTESDAEYICRKVLNMRLFTNETTAKVWDQNVMQKNYSVLLGGLVNLLLGNKPDFHVAMPPQKAKPFYASLVDRFQKSYNPDAIKDGIFGAMMKVNLVNDGPVTMQIDSQASKNGAESAKES
ncbi:hypothetical protein ACFE04_003752 [Oxalis oulophora]